MTLNNVVFPNCNLNYNLNPFESTTHPGIASYEWKGMKHDTPPFFFYIDVFGEKEKGQDDFMASYTYKSRAWAEKKIIYYCFRLRSGWVRLSCVTWEREQPKNTRTPYIPSELYQPEGWKYVTSDGTNRTWNGANANAAWEYVTKTSTIPLTTTTTHTTTEWPINNSEIRNLGVVNIPIARFLPNFTIEKIWNI